MASIGTDKRGSRYVQFEDKNQRRRTIRLGKVSKRDAETVRLRVEKLAAARSTDSEVDRATQVWLNDIGDKLRNKLAKVNLASKRETATLGEFIASYKKARSNVAESTRKDWRPAFASLKDHFGDDVVLRDINKGQARDWVESLSPRLAENTVRKYTKIAKTLFNHAKAHELIDKNPFLGNPSTVVANEERMYYITRPEAAAVLDACPSVKWRLVFALARYGGLRCSSEVLAVKWGHVLWDEEKLIVPKVKTKQRTAKLFPELRSVLQEAFELAEDGTEYIVEHPTRKDANLGTTMSKIVRRAGLEPWPKLFQNLRSTRETELIDEGWNIKTVCNWIGNSPEVALKHYLQATEARVGDVGKSAANALQNGAESGCTAMQPKQQNPIFAESC